MPVLDWIGKKQVINHDKEVPFRLLRRVDSLSVGESENLIIKGEHLADREYKEEIGNIWGGLDERYKFMMVTKNDIEGKINKIKKF